MMRLILFALFAAGAIIVVTSVMALFRDAGDAPGPASPRHASAIKDRFMPDTFRTVAYVVLIVLMFGVTTGWLGGM